MSTLDFSLTTAAPEEMASHLQKLVAIDPGNDVTTLRAPAHALKGVAANLGLSALAALRRVLGY